MRFRRSLFVLSLLFFAAPAFAELKWDKVVQRFERTPDDKEVEAHYTFRNTGTTPVTIKSLRPSCGCTTARLEKKTYAPGEQGEVVARFAFGGRKDLHHLSIIVATDDKTAEPDQLHLLVNIHD